MTRFAAILCAAGLLAGCASDPLESVPRLSDTDVSATEIQAAIRAEEAEGAEAETDTSQRGLFGQLFGGSPAPVTDGPADVAEDTGQAEPVATAAAEPSAPARGGLLGFLQRAASGARASDSTAVELAALPSGQTDAPASSDPAAQAGAPQKGDPDYRIVSLGTALPYGTLARVCDVRTRELGRRVERYPERSGMYAIYDSDPGNTEPHTFYVTGFKDGCARQFTAALALFGSTETHERLRYGLPAKVQPYSATDAAYERLKSRICRVGRGKPCGAALPRLSRNTVFVSVYENFGSNPVWKTILIHDGEVVETDIRDNG